MANGPLFQKSYEIQDDGIFHVNSVNLDFNFAPAPDLFRPICGHSCFYKDRIYWGEEWIEGADPETFESLIENLLARDAKKIYLLGRALTGMDAKSLTVLGHDRGTVYLQDKKTAMAIVSRKGDFAWDHDQLPNGKASFDARVLLLKLPVAPTPERSLAMLKLEAEAARRNKKLPAPPPMDAPAPEFQYGWHRGDLYFETWSPIPAADRDSFAVISDTSARDKNNLYFYERISGPAPQGIRNLGEGFYADENEVYILWGGARVPLPGIDPASVQLMKPATFFLAYLRDKNDVYCVKYHNKISVKALKSKSPEQYVQMSPEFGRDQERVYYRGTPIKGVNAARAHFLKHGGGVYLCDGEKIYYDNKEIQGADVETFCVMEGDIHKAVDKNNYYREGIAENKYKPKILELSASPHYPEYAALRAFVTSQPWYDPKWWRS